ncbi:DUF535 domain-containing protein [Campylobacter coli]|nr:DUF535 domain-containing protein [Campylobacter coli]
MGTFFKISKRTIEQCCFCFTLDNKLLISCIQGYQYSDFNVLDINKIFTKKCYGLRPIALLIECIKMLCVSLKLDATLLESMKKIKSALKKERIKAILLIIKKFG